MQEVVEMAAKRVLLPADERKAQIIEAALAVFAERGYEGATVEGLARAAGIDKVLIYRHFDGQLGLFAAVVDAAVTRAGDFVAEVVGASAARGRPGEALFEVVKGMRENPDVLGVLALGASDAAAARVLDERRRALAEQLRALLYEARADEVSKLSDRQRAWLGDLVYGALVESLGNHVRNNPADTDEEFAAFAARALNLSVGQIIGDA